MIIRKLIKLKQVFDLWWLIIDEWWLIIDCWWFNASISLTFIDHYHYIEHLQPVMVATGGKHEFGHFVDNQEIAADVLDFSPADSAEGRVWADHAWID